MGDWLVYIQEIRNESNSIPTFGKSWAKRQPPAYGWRQRFHPSLSTFKKSRDKIHFSQVMKKSRVKRGIPCGDTFVPIVPIGRPVVSPKFIHFCEAPIRESEWGGKRKRVVVGLIYAASPR
jgi:hypothetical protein